MPPPASYLEAVARLRRTLFGAFDEEPHEREQEGDHPETRDSDREEVARRADEVVGRRERDDDPPAERVLPSVPSSRSPQNQA